MMTVADGTLVPLLRTVQARMARGELHLPPFPGGGAKEFAVPGADHIFVIHESTSFVRAVSASDLRRLSWCNQAAWMGAILLVSSWALTIIRFVAGGDLLPVLIAGGIAAALFMAPLLLARVITSPPEAVGSRHPLAPEAVAALTRVLEDAAAPSVCEVDAASEPSPPKPSRGGPSPGRHPAPRRGTGSTRVGS